VHFNRGAVASQEYTRQFGDAAPDELAPRLRQAAYRWLSRGLLEALLAFIARADSTDYELYGAVYEFQWPAVLDALRTAAASGARVHVVYDAIEGSSNPVRKNQAAIEQAGIGALCTPRTTGKIMHNKFFVLVQRGEPVAVWTGSTNVTENGLFGHLNCGHAVEDQTVAAAYLEYWGELGTNPDATTERAWMGEHNPSPPDPWTADLTNVFSPRSGLRVLNWYRDIAAGADRALFMTFAFGMDERFKEVYRTEDQVLRVALMDKEGSGRTLARARVEIGRLRRRPNVLVAVGKPITTNRLDRWLVERPGLSRNVQWVHTKFMLVDPLSDTPVVVAGSANFSEDSTSSNDENMLVIRGDTRVADIYLGEFLRAYAHYAFREAVAIAVENDETWEPSHLATTDDWQREYYEAGNDRDLRRRYFAHGT
jgi:phosphatidylserine/phosphatidylglycerophosphate/cardiolipin synthase-like enzyme